MGRGGNHLIAGLVAAFAIPLGAFGLHLPFVAVLAASAILYAGMALILAPRRAAERIVVGKGGHAQAELVGELIEEGETSVARLRAAARAIKAKTERTIVDHLADVARAILDRLAADPSKLSAVRRFLTYYLPRSTELAEGLVLVERQHAPDARRRAEIGATLDKLGQAFTYYADSLNQSELDNLDVELKLLTRSLAEDLGPRLPAEPAPVARKDS